MDISYLSLDIMLLLFIVSFVAGYLDTLAGGGGLITMPALLLVGMTPVSALATNKLQGSAGTATASYIILKSRHVNWRDVRVMMLYALLGSLVGTMIIQFVPISGLTYVIPVVLVVIGIYFIFYNKLQSKIQNRNRLSDAAYNRVIIPAIGGYDGMFGPGTGTFFCLSGTSLKGMTLRDSTVTAKLLNFSTNIAALFIFAASGHVVWGIGILMMAGQVLGASIGVRSLFNIKQEYIRYLIIVMSFGMLIKYLLQN